MKRSLMLCVLLASTLPVRPLGADTPERVGAAAEAPHCDGSDRQVAVELSAALRASQGAATAGVPDLCCEPLIVRRFLAPPPDSDLDREF